MKNEISLFDLPDSVRIRLSEEFRKKLLEIVFENSFEQTGKKLSVSRETFRRYFTGKRGIPLNILKQMVEATGISKEEIQDNVIELKTLRSKEKIIYPKLPFKILSEDFANVVGGVLCDGGIEKGKNRIWYFNKQEKQLQTFVEAVNNAFGTIRHARHRSISGTPCVIFPKIIGEILSLVGLTGGNKNYKYDLAIPEQYLKSSDEKVIGALVRRMFDDDGTVDRNFHARAVSLTLPFVYKEEASSAATPKIITQVQALMRQLGIKSRVSRPKMKNGRGEFRVSWCVIVSDKKNLHTFREKVGFDIDYKKERLDGILNTYTNTEYFDRNKAEQAYLNAMIQIEKKEPVTSKSLAVATSRNSRHIRETLLTLYNNGKISREQVPHTKKFAYHVIG